jgi:hypothetical protein
MDQFERSLADIHLRLGQLEALVKNDTRIERAVQAMEGVVKHLHQSYDREVQQLRKSAAPTPPTSPLAPLPVGRFGFNPNNPEK